MTNRTTGCVVCRRADRLVVIFGFVLEGGHVEIFEVVAIQVAEAAILLPVQKLLDDGLEACLLRPEPASVFTPV